MSPGILLSKCHYVDINIEFRFDDKYITKHAEYDVEEDEYEEEVSYSDNEIEVYDGYQTQYGRRVHRRLKPTGKKIRRVLTPALLQVPSISMTFQPTEHHESNVVTPFWQKIYLCPEDREELVANLISKHKLHSEQTDNIIQTLLPIICFVENSIRYSCNMCNLSYSFPVGVGGV